MRLIFDLFPCQTDSRLRGIGRYTLSLAKAMAAEARGHEMRLLANGLYPATTSQLRHEFSGLIPTGAFASYTHHPLAAHESCDQSLQQIASALVHTAYQSVGADALLHASPFEGWCEKGVVAQTRKGFPAGLKVALLYDFIPWLFPEQHLDPVPAYKEWYAARLAALNQYDVLLAISEATRQDAIRVLGIAPERVVNISGAADQIFRQMSTAELAGIELRRFGIVRPFVMYTGNGDYRKNLSGMVSAYAALPQALRETHQLVVNQVGDRAQFTLYCQAHGLSEDDVIVTGHITDDELLALYNQCKVFVFPSLYEGFGLPVLEAMACGAPVLAADNSSIAEVVGRADLLFDATLPGAISAKIAHALTDPEWCLELRAYSLERAATFSWDKCASAAWQAIEHALQARQIRTLAALKAQKLPRKRIAAVLAVPPGQAYDRAASMVAALAGHFDITVVAEPGQEEGHYLSRHSLPTQWQHFDTVLYLAAPETITPAFVALVRSAPGVLLLQSSAGAKVSRTARPPTDASHANQILRDEGLQGMTALHLQRPNQSGTALPLPRSLLEGLSGLVLEGGPAVASTLTAGSPAMTLPAVTLLPIGSVARAKRSQLLAMAIHRGIGKNWRQASASIADAWRGVAPDEVRLGETARHAERNLRLNRSGRLLVDVTQMAKTDALSGIQRVVRNIARELCLLDEVDMPIELVELRDCVLHRASDVASSVLDIGTCPPAQIDIQPGDILLMIDSSWEQYPYFASTFDAVRQFGGRIITVIYDLIPLRMPEYCSAGLVTVFEEWIAMAVQHSDMLLCISRAVRDDVRAYIAEQDLAHQPTLRLEYWHLGADIMPQPRDVHVRSAVAELVADQVHPLFLMVGTIEPRKGHAVVLDAFELLWERGSEVRLCLAGKEGWEVDALMTRIRLHPELGRRLHFIERFSDAEINLCYSGAHGLITASVAEGYGLPIVEAAQHQVPVLATDIPVFREVAGEGARYFPVGDSFALAELVLEFASLDLAERRALAARVTILSWQESARRAWQAVRSNIELRRDVTGVELQPSNAENPRGAATV